MTVPNFKRLAIAEDATAEIDLYLGDDPIGIFRCRFVDTSASGLRLDVIRRNRRLTPQERRRLDNPKTQADIDFAHERAVDLFLAQGGLVDWELEGADGQPVAFSIDHARAFFLLPEYRRAFQQVEIFATDESNFTAATKDSIAGGVTARLDFELRLGADIQHLRHRATKGLPTPELDNEPVLGPEAAWLYDAFVQLASCRDVGLAMGPVPWVAIDCFARRYAMCGPEFDAFSWQIRHIDAFWRAHAANQPGDQTGDRAAANRHSVEL